MKGTKRYQAPSMLVGASSKHARGSFESNIKLAYLQRACRTKRMVRAAPENARFREGDIFPPKRVFPGNGHRIITYVNYLNIVLPKFTVRPIVLLSWCDRLP